MLSIYPAILYGEKERGYSVVFPDLNHLAICGDTLNEAMAMAVNCLAGYIYSEELDGNMVQESTSMDKVDIHCEDDADSDYVNMVYMLVHILPNP